MGLWWYMEIKDKFIKKLYTELQQYNEQCENKTSGKNSKLKICSYTSEIFISSADKISDMLLRNLVNQSTNILESICEKDENVLDTKGAL